MKPSDFLAEFDDCFFPKNYGVWITLDAHDPPFAMEELISMQRRGLIELNEAKEKYRLTIEATKLRFGREYG